MIVTTTQYLLKLYNVLEMKTLTIIQGVEAADESISKTKGTPRNRKVSSINNECLEKIKACKGALRKLKSLYKNIPEQN